MKATRRDGDAATRRVGFSRRDLLMFVGGGAAGMAFTPVPWKLLDDSAIWTQNWSWIPKPPRGEPKVKFTTCTLCQAGCPLRARAVGGSVVSVMPAAGSALCPVGVAAHHMPYHAARVRQPLRRGKPLAIQSAIAGIRAAMANGPAALLDMRPGRTASLVHRRAAAALAAMYVVPADEPFAVDLTKAKTVLSFGAPVLDGWGTPARVLGARPNLRLIQIEPVESHTALLADEWVPLKPGTEAALALGLARALGADFAQAFTPERVAAVTGLPRETILALARTVQANGPALAIAGCDPAGGRLDPQAENAIAGLNGALHAPLFKRREAPGADDPAFAVPMALDDVPDRGIAVLLIDEAPGGGTLPWNVLRRKMAPGAVVVAMTSSADGIARHADYVIPATVFPETMSDAGSAVDQPAARFSLAPPLAPKPAWAFEPAEFLMRLAGQTGTVEDELKRRVEAIKTSQRGVVTNYADANQTPAKDVADLWKALTDGAVWTGDDVPDPARLEFNAAALELALAAPASREFPLTAVPSAWRTGPVSPLVTKLWVESGLREAPGTARMHPETARRCGIGAGGPAAIRTACGSSAVTVACDPAVMPGVVEIAVGPGGGGQAALDLCDPGADCTWRTAPAALVKG